MTEPRSRNLISLTIVNRSGRPVPREFLTDWVSRMARLMTQEIRNKIPNQTSEQRFRQKEFVIAFVTRAEIRRLNRDFRGKNRATDVLSFESVDPSSFGELAIAPEIISKQARQHGLLVREELGYMVLHGFLHLLGYDHEKDAASAKQMFRLQDGLFETLRR